MIERGKAEAALLQRLSIVSKEMGMNTETVQVTIADRVAKVVLNRPKKKNAMNPELHADMTEVLETLRYEDSARVIVITGAATPSAPAWT